MKKVPVKSSVLAALGYDLGNNVLRTWLINGTIYDYYKVPVEEYENLLHAESTGEHYNVFIRDLFEYRRIA